MNKQQLKELIYYLFSQMLVAGDYALRVQPRVKSRDEKGGNIFQAALTDADLSIQGFFEVGLLARYPEVGFYGEEEAGSLNTRYFPQGKDWEITLDPVNGTRLFVDQFDSFDIVATVSYRDQIMAAASYLPGKRLGYYALRGEGAYTLTRAELEQGQPGERLAIRSKDKRIFVFNEPELLAKLTPKLEAFDFLTLYMQRPTALTLVSFLAGDVGGWVRSNAPQIDLGAVGFIAREAGACESDFSGREIERYPRAAGHTTPSQIVAVDQDLHQRVLEAIQA